MGPAPRPAVERFWPKVDRSGGDDACWVWTGARTRGGYGNFFDGTRNVRSHRFSWSLVHGPIPPDQMVCHRCDNPPCVNPAHLFLGDVRDNAWDAVAKGRAASGERVPQSTLTGSQVVAIRSRFREPRAVLASEFGVSAAHVGRIIHRRTWRGLA